MPGPLIPAEANQVTGDHYRITVLTPRMLRLEYSPTGRFEDRATQMVLNRDLGPVEFQVVRDAAGLHLSTEAVVLDYDELEFSAAGLTIRLAGPYGYHSQWRYGIPNEPNIYHLGNLGGTARTLDMIDGACELEDGLVASNGYAVLDDHTIALDGDWVAPRMEGNTDTYYFGYGSDAAGAVRDFYRLTGPQPLLPRWALGNWWSRYYAYSATEYQALVERFEAEELPFSVAVVDMDWHRVDVDPRYGSGWTGYSWNTDLFPDPSAFLAWLHEHGLKVSLNVHPADGVRALDRVTARYTPDALAALTRFATVSGGVPVLNALSSLNAVIPADARVRLPTPLPGCAAGGADLPTTVMPFIPPCRSPSQCGRSSSRADARASRIAVADAG